MEKRMKRRSKLLKMLCFVVLVTLSLSGCMEQKVGAAPQDNPEITEQIDSIIEEMADQLGEPPDDVIGFGAGYKRETAITPGENAALHKLFRAKSSVFSYYDMDCAPTVTLEDMLTYDPESTQNQQAGYAEGNNIWIGKAGYSRYDKLGNLSEEINKCSFDLVSLDKTIKKASSEKAQAEIDLGSIYAYWIVSLPDDNILDGVVYDKGADDKLEPVKKGTLHFKRVGPGPSEVDVTVTVNKNGTYKTEGELTAGHYEVSFDAKDGKGEKTLNKNWLYIPGKTPTQDWNVLVRQTYQITYDFTHNTISTGEKNTYDVHMEWHDIPIDWTVESEEALQLARDLSYPDLYCLTYEYYQNDMEELESYTDHDDESETESTPGYEPTVVTEHSPYTDGGEMKLSQKPTLSFFRGADQGMFMKDAYYVDLEYEVALYVDGQCIPVPIAVELIPMTEENEVFYEKQGWGMLSRIARLDNKASDALIQEGKPLILTYEDTAPEVFKMKLVIEPEE